LRGLGFGKSIMEASISEEIEDVIKELKQCEVLQVSKWYSGFLSIVLQHFYNYSKTIR
jgi:hypothetical protein